MDLQNTSTNKQTIYDSDHMAETKGMDFDSNTNTTGATTFVGEAEAAFLPVDKPTPFQGADVENDVIGYLSRPRPLVRGAFTNGARQRQFGFTVDATFLNNIMGSNNNGALGIRATLCFRLDVSAAPQVSGILKMAVLPFGNNLGPDRTGYVPMYCQIPNVEINLAESSTAEIRLPFVFDRDYYTFSSTDALATIQLATYAPVAWDAASTSAPTFVCYQWLEDVQLVGKAAVATTLITPQGVGSNSEKVGPLSSFFNSASRLTSWVGKGIPAISAYTKPVSWALSGFGNLAAHFGYSKPNDGTNKVMASSYLRAYNTALDVGQATEMGMFANNEVDALPGFAGSDRDEMSICYLSCIPGNIAYFHLLTTDAGDSYKWSCPVTPNRFYFYKTPTNVGFAQPARPDASQNIGFLPSPLMALAQHFTAWRGDLIFRFKFSRTKFHGGKILIGYNPKFNDVAANLPSDSRYNFKTVLVDLRSTSEVEFEVPFTYHRPFCCNEEADPALGSTGMVFLKVIDPICAPTGVVQNIPVLVEVFAKCGLEFAMPTTPFVGNMPSGTAVTAQSQTQHVVGEEIKSVKQLLVRPCPVGTVTYTGNTSINENVFLTYQTPVFNAPSGGWISSSFYGLTGALSGSRFADILSWYGLWRGSLVYWVQGFAGTDDRTQLTWGGGVGYSSSKASERVIALSAHRPFYAFNNRLRTNYTRGTGNSAIIPGLASYQIMLGGRGETTTRTELVSIAVGDDFQCGFFCGVPPMVTTLRESDANGTYLSVTPQGVWSEHTPASTQISTTNIPSPVQADGGYVTTSVEPRSASLARPPSPMKRRPSIRLTDTIDALADTAISILAAVNKQ